MNTKPTIAMLPGTPYIRILGEPPPTPEQRIALLQMQLKAYEDQVERLNKMQLVQGTVIAVHGDKTAVAIGDSVNEIDTPKYMPELAPGIAVRLRPDNAQIVSTYPNALRTGPIVVVTAIVDDVHAEVQLLPGQSRVVLFHGKAPRSGDRVQIDATANVIVRNLGQPASVAAFAEDTGVTWDDIGGLDEAKRQLIEAIEEPVKHAELYARFGKKAVKGAMLSGPTGGGKTMLARALHTALADLHGASAKASGFIYVKGPEVLSQWVGSSEAGVRRLFTSARAHFAEHGYAAVIVIDEADALLMRRDARRAVGGMESTIVPQFLAETDGFEAARAFVVLCTNRPDAIDPAVTRKGRVDCKVHVGRPDEGTARAIFGKHLRGRPLDGIGIDEASEILAREFFSDRRAMYRIRLKDGSDRRMTLGALASGALCAGIVERATQIAIRREIEKRSGGGITRADLADAVDAIAAEEQQPKSDHSAELAEYTEAFAAEVVGIEKIREDAKAIEGGSIVLAKDERDVDMARRVRDLPKGRA